VPVDEVPPPPEVDVTVDRFGNFNPRTRSATITGAVTCTGTAAFISVQLRQTVGRFVITGSGGIVSPCDGTTQPWSVVVFADNGGQFLGGRAVSVTFAQACTVFGCGFDFEERIVILRG
jgi:hypothetical protein